MSDQFPGPKTRQAIECVNENGQQEGNSPAWPTGVTGF